MLKVKLLKDGGYGDMENVKFPVIVEGEDFEGQGCDILGIELIRVGATYDNREVWDPNFKYHFYYGNECEVIEDDC